MNYDSIVAATAISAAIGSALVGIWGNLPFGLAPGMGLNSYFTLDNKDRNMQDRNNLPADFMFNPQTY